MTKKISFVGIAFFILSCNNLPAQSNRDSADSTSLSVFESATVFTLSGLNFNLYNSMPRKFRGIFSRSPYKMIQVKYPASTARNSITRGVEMLDAAVRATPGPKIIMGHSQGAQVCSRWMHEHANDTTAPGPGELMFILTGNPLRSIGGYIIGRKEVGGTIGIATPVNTPWKIIDFARRYDGWADWVQDEKNKMAVRNANIGKQTLHKKYDEVDFISPTHSIWSKGNTTFVLTREENLPVMKGNSYSIPEAQATRAKIEAAYTNRPPHDGIIK